MRNEDIYKEAENKRQDIFMRNGYIPFIHTLDDLLNDSEVPDNDIYELLASDLEVFNATGLTSQYINLLSYRKDKRIQKFLKNL